MGLRVERGVFVVCERARDELVVSPSRHLSALRAVSPPTADPS
jgi:hypothetical protein